jgi:hypothetical protein
MWASNTRHGAMKASEMANSEAATGGKSAPHRVARTNHCRCAFDRKGVEYAAGVLDAFPGVRLESQRARRVRDRFGGGEGSERT